MSANNHLERLKSLLSEEDRASFERLNLRLQEVGGDISQLTTDDIDLIEAMELKYGEKIKQSAIEHAEEILERHSGEKRAVVTDDFPLLKTEFADYVRDLLFRELGGQFSQLKDMVNYAFSQKWLPQELRNPDVCETLFERFYSDIEAANQWRQQMSGAENAGNDKTLAVGLTWFMYVFQLKQWIEKSGR